MFKFKDLYVTLAAERSAEGHPHHVAYYDVLQPLTIGSGKCPRPVNPGTTPCCEGQNNSEVVAFFPFPEATELKEFLGKQLDPKRLKKVAIRDSDSLETVAEVEALERKLNGALGELKNRKTQLQKKLAADK